MDRYLPAAGFERLAFVVLAGVLLWLRVLAIYHFRTNSDEQQHAHVVWAWATGRLQYRDVFDNHMPLFHMLCGPLMAMLGERADIMVPLRWAMMPFWLAALWAVYQLTAVLYSRGLAAWSALFAGTVATCFFTYTEFRADDLWGALWLLALAVAVSGEFTVRRAFCSGLLMGLTVAVSLKTVALLSGLAVAAVPAFVLAWIRGERLNPAGTAARLGVIIAGIVIPTAIIALYFASKGALEIMYYCTVVHQLVPGERRWQQFSHTRWYFPLSVPFMGAYAWLIFRQTPETRLAIRRTIIVLMPWCFLILLLSYFPDITREDDLPYVPLVPLSLVPLLVLVGTLFKNDGWRRNIRAYGLPALAVFELIVTLRFHDIRRYHIRTPTQNIADVLAITKPHEFVMDNKGEYVFRPRAFYWVIEPFTKARINRGWIQDDIPEQLTQKTVKICYLDCARPKSRTGRFIAANYLPFDPWTHDMGVLGKVIGRASESGTFSFEVVIPQTYAVITEAGKAAGELDGKPYTDPVWLTPGKHEFHRTGGSGRTAIFLGDAYKKGFSPMFDAADAHATKSGNLSDDDDDAGPT